MTLIPILDNWSNSERRERDPLRSPSPSSFPACTLANFSKMESPSSPCIYTPPDALGTSTGDSISTHPNTIHADTPRPSVNDNISTSVNSVDDTAHPNDVIVNQLLSISELAASLSSQSLSPQQKIVVTAAVSAMISTLGGKSKDKPVDLATPPSSSDQDKSL